MADFDPLDPHGGCHPLLPANVPVDEIRYSTIMPIAVDAEGRPAQIPLATVLPGMFKNVSIVSDPHRRALERAAGAGSELVPTLSPGELESSGTPTTLKLGSLGTLIQDGGVKVGDRALPLQLDAATITHLAAGLPAKVRLLDPGFDADGAAVPGGEEVLLEPDYPVPPGKYLCLLDAAGLTEMLSTGTVLVARVGRKAVQRDGEQIDRFLRDGEATLRFTDNSRATLRIVRPGPGARGAAPLPAALWTREPGGGRPEQAVGGLTLNVADRFALRMASAPHVGHAELMSSAQALSVDLKVDLPESTQQPLPPPPRGGTYSTAPLPPPPPVPPPTLPLVLYLPFVQTWTLRGYARGALLNTLSLAPQEETTLEVFSWERRRREAEEASSSENESLLEGSLNNKDTLEVVDDAKRENGWKFDAGLNVSIPNLPIGGNLGLDVKDQLTHVAKTTAQQISDATTKASAKIKATRQTRVIETSEFGTERKALRRLRNPNMGHTLNLDCFEVVAHYEALTRIERTGIRLAVLVPMADFLAPILAPGRGQKEALLAFEHVIEPLIPPRMRAGFVAARRLLAAERLCLYRCAAPCQCTPSDTTAGAGGGPAALSAQATASREATLLAQLAAPVQRVRQATQAIAAADVANLGRTIKQHWDNLGNPAGQPPSSQWDTARQEVRRYLFRRFAMEGPATRFWSEARSFAAALGGGVDEAAARRLMAARRVQGTDVANAVTSFALLLPRVVGEIATIIGSGWPLVAPDIVANGLAFEDGGLEAALNEVEAVLQDLDAARTPAPGSGANPPQAGTSGGTGTNLPAPVAAVKELGDQAAYAPKELAEASIEFDVLVSHLGHQANFFRAQLWRSIDGADRLRFLAIYGRLATLTSGRILGFVGTSALLEVDVTRDEALRKWFDTMVLANASLDETSEIHKAVLPTPGVTLEARLGACDGLEPYLVGSRKTELERVGFLAQQEALEVERLKHRLDAKLLDDPRPRSPLVLVDKPPASPS